MALLLAFAGAACSRKEDGPRGETLQVMEGFTMTQSVAASPRWSLQASSARLREEAKEADLTDPVMEFQKNGKLASRARALRGLLHTETHDVALSSAVVVESFEDHSVLNTEKLDYSSKTDLFITEENVLVTRPDGVLRGRGLKAKPDLSEIRIFDQQAVMSGAPKP
jgi:LPS export ABC transporter protein LptC